MSREKKDSELIYELVASKYKIAERNRLAKFRFLSQMNKVDNETGTAASTITRRDSEPSLANVEKFDGKRIDLSVPGTPVSSRYISLLRHAKCNKNVIDSDSENEDYDGIDENNIAVGAVNPSELSGLLNEQLKIFTNEMDKLNEVQVDNSSSHDPLKKYFEDSDRKRTYRRDFSDVVSEFPLKKKVETKIVKKVDKYFAESTKLNSFKREFNDVVGKFDPKNPTAREQFVDLSVVGTPISSRLIAVTKMLTTSTIENDIKITDSKPSAINAMNSNNIEESKNSQVHDDEVLVVIEGNERRENEIESDDVNEEARKDGNKLIIIENENEQNFEKEKIESSPAVKIESQAEVSCGNGAENNNELISFNDCKVSRGSVEIESQNEIAAPLIQDNNAVVGRFDVADNCDDAAEKNENDEKVKSNHPKRLKRSDSAASDVSIPGTPVSSRALQHQRSRHISDTDDSGSETTEGVTKLEYMEIAAMAKEFVNEIENLVQKSFDDDDKQEIALNEVKNIEDVDVPENLDVQDENLNENKGGADEKLTIYEKRHRAFVDQFGTSNEVCKVNKYLEESDTKVKSFSRTFSEIEQFNNAPYVPPKDVKQRVDQYFRESERRGSLKRPFSQAIEYLGPKVESKIEIKNQVKPGTPVSSVNMNIPTSNGKQDTKEKENENIPDPEYLKGQEILKRAQEAIESAKKKFAVNEYFEESKDRQTYQRNFSEIHEDNISGSGSSNANKNPEIAKYFEHSEAQKSFQRTFSEAVQELEPTISTILGKPDEKQEKPFHYQRSSRASSISSNCSDISDVDSPSGRKSKKHGKKYGIDKYFATSLYRTAYHRSNSRRQSTEAEGITDSHQPIDDIRDMIVEDEFVFGETSLLAKTEFQYDDETRVTTGPNDVNGNQTVEFWREFLKPYNLNLQSEIKITKEEFMNNNRTLE